MWSEESRWITPMGNIYATRKQGRWLQGVITNKLTGEERIQCHSTRSRRVLEYYCEVLFLLEEDCLKGGNPYVTKKWCLKFRDQK